VSLSFVPQGLTVTANSAAALAQARQISDDLGTVLVAGSEALTGLVLEVSESGLALRDYSQPKSHPLRLDVTRSRYPGATRDLLARALGKKCRSVIDATAGFGADSFDFVRRGYRVTAIERVRLISLMLIDAASRCPDQEWLDRFQVIEGESIDWIPRLHRADVIFLDPMFPDIEKKTAQPRKAQQLLRQIAGSDSGSVDLLNTARRFAGQRVVVKRPRSARPLGAEPDHRFMGRSIRYDVYFSEKL
jgi:16S rRNA (guanine1516-N2)-methyltransferase